jgi:hypothetical protein
MDQYNDTLKTGDLKYLWINTPPTIDQHVAFRLTFTTTTPSSTMEISHFAVSWYKLFVDNIYLAEGPTRFIDNSPYYAKSQIVLAAGKHVIAVHVHNAGISTRMLLHQSPVIAVNVKSVDSPQCISTMQWKCHLLSSCYKPATRLSNLLGFTENVNVTLLQQTWKNISFDDTQWSTPVPATTPLKLPISLDSIVNLLPASSVNAPLQLITHGSLVERHGYPSDNPPARFRLRKLTETVGKSTVPVQPFQQYQHTTRTVATMAVSLLLLLLLCYQQLTPSNYYMNNKENINNMATLIFMMISASIGITVGYLYRHKTTISPPMPLDYGPPQGVWWRYDALRCQLLCPIIQMKPPPIGTTIEICYCQELIDGKASPYHPLTGGSSNYIDRYVMTEDMNDDDVIEISPLEPRGCRYIEIHVTFDDQPNNISSIHLLSVTAMYRTYSSYHINPIGSFHSKTSSILTEIWEIGSNTTRSCIEDACIDGPCRERGQWTGDTLAVTLPNLVYM